MWANSYPADEDCAAAGLRTDIELCRLDDVERLHFLTELSGDNAKGVSRIARSLHLGELLDNGFEPSAASGTADASVMNAIATRVRTYRAEAGRDFKAAPGLIVKIIPDARNIKPLGECVRTLSGNALDVVAKLERIIVLQGPVVAAVSFDLRTERPLPFVALILAQPVSRRDERRALDCIRSGEWLDTSARSVLAQSLNECSVLLSVASTKSWWQSLDRFAEPFLSLDTHPLPQSLLTSAELLKAMAPESYDDRLFVAIGAEAKPTVFLDSPDARPTSIGFSKRSRNTVRG
jgi:hypothetical protein